MYGWPSSALYNAGPMSRTLAAFKKKTTGSSNSLKKKEYQCRFCDKVFITAAGRYFHEPIQTGKYKFTCDICDKGFMKQLSYRDHLRTHRKQFREYSSK